MYEIKNRIYKSFDKTQKSAICHYIRSLVKQNLKLGNNEILNKFIADEQYYLELNVSRFQFLKDYLEDEEFLRDTSDYIKECKKYYDYKESQRPIIEANKRFEKQKRKFLQEVKMSKELPTKKQLYYYEKLCKKYAITMKNTEELSKLDLKNEIESILDEHTTD